VAELKKKSDAVGVLDMMLQGSHLQQVQKLGVKALHGMLDLKVCARVITCTPQTNSRVRECTAVSKHAPPRARTRHVCVRAPVRKRAGTRARAPGPLSNNCISFAVRAG
jgi:hypothetical protein